MQIQEDKPYDDINITPMLDLAYVLLVIFILMCTASVQGMKVALPKSSGPPPPPLAKPKMQAITITNDGKIFLNTSPSSIADLTAKLTAAKAQNPDLPLVIRGDGTAQYQTIMDVMSVAGNIGINEIGLATKSGK